MKKLKVAIIYDRVNTHYGGAEHVIRAIQEIFPHAPIFTSVYSLKAQWASHFKILPSFLQKLKPLRDHHQWLVWLMPLAFESFDLNQYNLIISITSAEAKGVVTNSNQLHVCYLLTPTRYLYSHKESYLQQNKLLSLPVFNQLAKLLQNYLTWWDQVAIYRPDFIIPISQLIKKRAKKYYSITTGEPIYPPLNTKLRKPTEKKLKQSYLLSVSRLVGYKLVDLSIKACLKLNKTLVVVGTGEQERYLHQLASSQAVFRNKDETIKQLLTRANKEAKLIIFTQQVSDQELNLLYSNMQALLMPGEEDFGITGLEASIFYKPVILFYKSGVAELLNKQTAIFINQETVAAVVKAVQKLQTKQFDNYKEFAKLVKKHNTDNFKKQFKKIVLSKWKQHLCHT